MQKLLFRKRREALEQLKGLVDGVGDIDAASFFKALDDGFQDSGACASGLLILLPGPKEATGNAHLHIEERYSTSAPYDLVHYRYEICWQFDRDISASRDDYLRDSLITLRRGVRFDHHPGAQDVHHPEYHWHPNGCSEFRLESCQMSPLKTALLATMMFDRSRVEKLTDQRFTNAMDELRKAISGLP